MDSFDQFQFDEAYVISDLHLGGEAGFQIFDQSKELRAFLASITGSQKAKTGKESQKSVCLVINGDLVDFLADKDAKAFDPERAVTKLDKILEEKNFAGAWKGLREFVASPGRTLVITLGNHDLELALPWVRRHLLDALSDGDEAARGRIVLAFDGTGFRFRVGGTRVLCVHGNEVDAWNITDYEKLRRISRDATLGQPVEKWVPNSGSRLVVEVMNGIKRNYPFVDLLKPETDAVVPILVAIDAASEAKIRDIGAVAAQKTWDQIRHFFGFLGEGAPVSETAKPREFRMVDPKAALRRAEENMARGVNPLDLVSDDAMLAQLGWREWVSGTLTWMRGKSQEESVREVLKQLKDDRSFEPAASDETFERLDELVGAQIDVVVAGHTHLARAIQRRKRRGYYYNSGTWVKLMRLTSEQVASDREFNKFFGAILRNDPDALGEYVFHTRTVVRFQRKAGSTVADLCHWNADALEPVSGTDYKGS